jgi:TNF receptor-associated factor 4
MLMVMVMMSGEYDDILEWPFHGEVTIELLNQLEDENHHKKVVLFNESTSQQSKSRVIGQECATNGRGYPQFISHSQLDVNPSLNCQYLKDDTLYFRVSVEVTSNTKPWLVA